MWKIVITKEAKKDLKKIAFGGLTEKLIYLIEIIQNDPLKVPPAYEKLHGKLDGYYSRRINIQHRLVYQIYNKQSTVKIIRMWTHYE